MIATHQVKRHGCERLGGLVGFNTANADVMVAGFVRDSYATGAVTGATGNSTSTGGFAGIALTAAPQSQTVTLQGATISQDSGEGTDENSGKRTSSQLRCPTTSNEQCSGATTYPDWDSGTWYFGSARTLPLLRGQTDIPVAPITLSAVWKSGNSLELSWQHGSARTYELEIGDTLRETSTTTFELDDALLLELRNNYVGGAKFTYTVRASETDVVGFPATASFSLLDSPSTARINKGGAGASTKRVTLMAPENDGYGRSPNNDQGVYGSMVDETALDLRYVVQLFRGRDGELVAERESPADICETRS